MRQFITNMLNIQEDKIEEVASVYCRNQKDRLHQFCLTN